MIAVDGDARALAIAGANDDRRDVALLHHLETGPSLRGPAPLRRLGRPRDLLMKTTFLLLQTDGYENTRDHAAGRIAFLVEHAGFAPEETYASLRTAWGQPELIEATWSWSR